VFVLVRIPLIKSLGVKYFGRVMQVPSGILIKQDNDIASGANYYG